MPSVSTTTSDRRAVSGRSKFRNFPIRRGMSLSERICSATMSGLSSFLKAMLITDRFRAYQVSLPSSPRRSSRRSAALSILVDDVWSRDIFYQRLRLSFRSAVSRQQFYWPLRWSASALFYRCARRQVFGCPLSRGERSRGTAKRLCSRGLPAELARRLRRNLAGTLRRLSVILIFLLRRLVCRRGRRLHNWRSAVGFPPVFDRLANSVPHSRRGGRRRQRQSRAAERPAPPCTPPLLRLRLAARAKRSTFRPARVARSDRRFSSVFFKPCGSSSR